MKDLRIASQWKRGVPLSGSKAGRGLRFALLCSIGALIGLYVGMGVAGYVAFTMSPEELTHFSVYRTTNVVGALCDMFIRALFLIVIVLFGASIGGVVGVLGGGGIGAVIGAAWRWVSGTASRETDEDGFGADGARRPRTRVPLQSR